MVALMAAPSVEQRFDTPDTSGATQLDSALGAYFTDRDADRTFACDEVLSLS